MNELKFVYEKTCLIDLKQIEETAQKIIPEVEKIRVELSKGYDSYYAFANVPSDLNNLHIVQELASKKIKLNPSVLIVIGIGGSNLGTAAVHEAINGVLYNNRNPKLKVYFADTVDSDYISEIYSIVEKELRSHNNVLLNVISKSGTTTETVAIFELFLNLLKKYKFEEFKDYIVITTDRGSILWDYALEIDCSLLEIPKKVGGRYSVFTSVGLFPLSLLNIDIKALLSGAHDIVSACLNNNIWQNVAAISSSIVYRLYNSGIKINDTFLFSVDLEGIGKWFRQLMGESIGKEFNLKNEKVNISITPTVSIGSTDLHSVGQLYLSSYKERFTTFIALENLKTNIKMTKMGLLSKILNKTGDIELTKIMNAIIEGVQIAYHKKQIPFCTIFLKNKSEYDVGQFLQLKMFEIVYLGYLLDINPFDQPNVELYKNETKQILASKEYVK